MSCDLTVRTIDPNYVDSRMIHLEAEFFQLTKTQSDMLLCAFVAWCSQLLSGQFITSWFWGAKKEKPEVLLKKIPGENVGVVSVEGAAAGEYIYNSKTLEQYKRALLFPSPEMQKDTMLSDDYLAFYLRQLEKRKNNELSWKDTILSFFNEPHRIPYGAVTHLDVQGRAVKMPYHFNSSLFYGTIELAISVHSLGEGIRSISKEMVRFLSERAKELANINGRVAITPFTFPSKCSGHMHYFGNNIQVNESNLPAKFFPVEWFPHYYICGAEWYNVISPLAQTHQPRLMENAGQCSGIVAKQYPNGSIAISVDKQPDCLDIADLVSVKHILYECLYPGMSRMSKQDFLNPNNTGYISKPRMRWECVPIFETEIFETEDDIVFRHANCVVSKS